MKMLIAVLFAMTSWLSVNAYASDDYRSDAAIAEQSALSLQDQLKNYLFSAARRGDTDMLQEFITAGFDLNTRDSKGYTALILAAYSGHKDATEQLINAGADVCAKDNRGNTALMGAIFKGELRIAHRLMKEECAIHTANHAGQTPAMYAALFQRTEMLQALREQGVDFNAEDQFGNKVENLLQGDIKTTLKAPSNKQ